MTEEMANLFTMTAVANALVGIGLVVLAAVVFWHLWTHRER